jgi:transketolase
MAKKDRIKNMKILATGIRIETIRQMAEIGFGHIGGSMSIADLLAVLYGGVMRLDPKTPDWEDRDFFVCSKGHAGPAVYAALALRGFFPMEWLSTLNRPGTNLPSHVDRTKTPGIDMTMGSLGHGLSVAVGLALGSRASGKENRVYVLVGDGESQEGQIWEAAMVAAHRKLSRLTCFVDFNNRQIDGTLQEVNDISNFTERYAAFGWHTQEVDGHDCAAIADAIEFAKMEERRPSAIVLRTKKGKGCFFVEDLDYNHHVPMPKEESLDAISRLEKLLAELEQE